MVQGWHFHSITFYSKENNLRFTLIKDLKKDKGMKPVLTGLVLFIILYILADFAVKHSSIGLFSDSLILTLLGNADEFLDPISKSSFLELIHAEIFFLMMILLTLSAVFIRLNSSKRFSLLILNLTMMGAIISLLSLGLSYFVSISFIHIYVVSFFIWHFGALYMSILSFWRLHND